MQFLTRRKNDREQECAQQKCDDRSERNEELADDANAYVDSDAHGRKTAWLALRLWRAMNLASSSEALLVMAATYHDVGKFFVSADIREKQTQLSHQEISLIRNHTWYGRDFLLRTSHSWAQADVAMLHHERWDGRGYPLQLCGDQIPLMARVTAVADVFDALTSERCYKPAWTVARSIEAILSARETQFDPGCVDGFELIAGELASEWDAVCRRFFNSTGSRTPP